MIASERCGPVLVATLSRSPVNAVDAALLARLDTVIDAAEADDGISVLHLRSAHAVFCAGADLALTRECIASRSPREASPPASQTRSPRRGRCTPIRARGNAFPLS